MRIAFDASAFARSVLISALILTLHGHRPAHAQTAERFTCPNSSPFEFRRNREVGTLSARNQRPSAGRATSADLAKHARLSAMSYAMYEIATAGGDPLDALSDGLKPVALIHGDPGPDARLRLRKARNTRTFYGVVADDPSTQRRLIVLRGTLQPNEWIRNLQARLRPFLRSQVRRTFPGGGMRRLMSRVRVHNGFMKIYQSLDITPIAGGARIPFSVGLADLVAGRAVTVIGHSLGGALATLAGVEAATRSPSDGRRLRVVTFASPRVGNAGFAKLAQSVGRIDRVCNVVDLVPAVPPSTRLAPYVHVGNVFRLSSFDWPRLENWHARAGKQITCWHSIATYAFMTDPDKSTRGLDGCMRTE